jgi:hypothetical protein
MMIPCIFLLFIQLSRPLINDQSKMSNFSGGFTVPTTPHREKTPLASQRPSNSSIFLAGNEEHSSESINDSDTPPNVPSSSPQQYSPAVVRIAPLYISVYTSTPPIPLVKGIVASSTPSTNNDELFFTRRSPSPKSSSILKTSEHPNTPILPSVYKHHHYPSTSQQK